MSANKELNKLFLANLGKSIIENTQASKGIKWYFICPTAPQHGGFWEATVKSAKNHLLKVTQGVLLNLRKLPPCYAV